MTYHDKTQLIGIFIAPPDQAAEVIASLKVTGLGWRLPTTVMGRKLS
jgi:hypothetical protein